MPSLARGMQLPWCGNYWKEREAILAYVQGATEDKVDLAMRTHTRDLRDMTHRPQGGMGDRRRRI